MWTEKQFVLNAVRNFVSKCENGLRVRFPSNQFESGFSATHTHCNAFACQFVSFDRDLHLYYGHEREQKGFQLNQICIVCRLCLGLSISSLLELKVSQFRELNRRKGIPFYEQWSKITGAERIMFRIGCILWMILRENIVAKCVDGSILCFSMYT